jgi:O-antigen ligase
MLDQFSSQIDHIRHTNIWKYAIAVVLCVFAFLLGRDANIRLVELLIAGIVGVILFAILNLRIGWGLLMLVPIALWVPFELGTGRAVSINLAFLWLVFILGVWLAKEFIGNKRIQLIPSPVNLPAILFIVSASISLLAGNLNWIMMAAQRASLFAQLGGWMLIVLSVLALLFMGNQIHEIRILKQLTWLYLLGGAIFVAGFILPVIGSRILSLFNGTATTAMFRTWVAAMAMGQCLFNKDLDRKWRIGLGSLAILAIYVGWSTDKTWISGWLPPLIAVWILFWLRDWKLGLAVTVLGTLALIPEWPRVYARVYTTTQQYSTESRISTWPIMLELIKASPIFGLGPANYYYYTPLYPLLGWYVNFNSHNNYIDIVAQTGLVGFFLFIWLIFEIGRLGWKLRTIVSDSFSQGYVNGVLAGLAASLASGVMADWFLPFLYNIGLPGFRASIFAWIFLGGLISIFIIQNNLTSPSSSKSPIN